MNELEKDLTIDVQRLDSEWIKLPSLYFAYREEADKLDAMLRKAKVDLEIETSKADTEYRQHPRQYFGCDKATEAQVKNAVEADSHVVEVKLRIVDLTKRRAIVLSAVAALEMKRDSLKNLVALQNSEYFVSKPILPEDDSGNGGFEAQRRNIRREIRDRLKSPEESGDKPAAENGQPSNNQEK